MEKRRIKGLIWDMDGTLLNTLDDIIGACNETLKAWGLPEKPKAEMTMYIGYGAKYLCHSSSGLEGDDLMTFLKDYRARTLTRDDPKTQIYDGIAGILERTKRLGMRHGIYTNKPQFWCEKLAKKFFVEGIFDAIVGVEEGKVLKPKPDGIEQMCRAWGIEPQEVVMIGDTPVDWETAKNTGCLGVCVTWGFRTRDYLEKAGVSEIVETAEELEQWIHEHSAI